MAEIFKEAQAFDNHPNRWNHDLSHKIYGSFKAGRLYPVMTHLMCPTEGFELDMASLLQFMPTPTPLQSNVRVIFHVFFDRIKNVWEDFPNTLEMLEEHDFPYILPSVTEFTAGSLHDYLDVPCCVVVDSENPFPVRYLFGEKSTPVTLFRVASGSATVADDYDETHIFTAANSSYGFGLFLAPTRVAPGVNPDSVFQNMIHMNLERYPYQFSDPVCNADKVKIGVCLSSSTSLPANPSWKLFNAGSTSANISDEPYEVLFTYSTLKSTLDSLGYDGSQYLHFVVLFTWGDSITGHSYTVTTLGYDDQSSRTTLRYINGDMIYFVNGNYSYADFPDLCPFATKEFPDRPIRLNAWRHRTYEANYNAFYRNIHGNQPFVIDGVTQYNKYNTTRASGLDETNYGFFNRNWELDAYTSAIASPQQGNPPLVGVTSLGRLTIQSDDGTVSTAQLQDLDDGQQGLAISHVNLANDEHRRILMNLASSGISINDLRETNALQRFLETNIRKGFRYIDFIKGHFGKAPKHAEMDMPEFLGGFAVKLDVGKVTNTNQAAVAEDPNAVLGQFAGSAQAFGGSRNKIRFYADDYGFVQVIMCIVPDSAYSQILPKDYLYREALDLPFPEFSMVSYQPITYEEFCPGEAYKDFLADPSKKITDVFGYQRPQHERVWLPDRLHGQFLTSMNNYAVNRVFNHRPELGDDFFQIKPEEMQRNFMVVKGDNDIAFGQVGFHFIVKQPVPRVVIPALGR